MGDFIDAPEDFAISDVPDDVDVVDVQTRADAAIEAATTPYLRELEKHAVAAWMAGFDALDHVTPLGAPPHAGDDVFDPAVPTITGRVRPVDDVHDPAPYAQGYHVERYDLRDLTPEQAVDARRRWGDWRD
jgi:hypothetical protein